MHNAIYTPDGKDVEILCAGSNLYLVLGPGMTKQRAAGVYAWFTDHYREIAGIEEIEEPLEYESNNYDKLNNLARMIALTKSPAIRLRGQEVLRRAHAELEPPIVYEPKKKALKKPEFVYILQGQGACKIGRARDIRKRVDTFSPNLPFPTRLIGTIQSDDCVTSEKQLHARFAAKRTNGEWFALTASDLKEIENMPGFVDYSEDK
jgi:hypothetical protein